MRNNENPNRKINRFAFSDFWEFPSIDRMTYGLFDSSKTMEFHLPKQKPKEKELNDRYNFI